MVRQAAQQRGLIERSKVEIREKIQAYVDAGCTTPILRFASWDQKTQLVRALAEVLPEGAR